MKSVHKLWNVRWGSTLQQCKSHESFVKIETRHTEKLRE